MNNTTINPTTKPMNPSSNREATVSVFADPIAYLATYGIAAELVSTTALPAAA